MSSKIHLSKWKIFFSQFIDKFLKTEEVEYLIHYVEFKMWLALFYLSSLCFSNIPECWCLAAYCVPQFTQRMKNEILNVALGWAFQFFPIDKRAKKLEFSRLGSSG